MKRETIRVRVSNAARLIPKDFRERSGEGGVLGEVIGEG